MFAKQLKSVMKERRISQTELSVRTGISKSGISQYLSGVHKPGMKALSALAEALEVPEEYLMDDSKGSDITARTAHNISVRQAAKLIGKGEQFIRVGLQRGILPFGYAVKVGSQYSYYINPKRFEETTGIKLMENRT